MKKLDRIFESPHKSYPLIHIAGTKGKGSTAYMLSAILQKAGYKVGLYTSPHISDVRERIQVNGKMISRNFFSSLINSTYDIRHTIYDIRPTYFEVLTIIGFEYFKKQKVDIAIIETGLGGRFDATNIIKPLISVITDISKDHTKELGDTLKKIAYEKSGIIKRGVPCISSSNKKAVVEVVKEQCRKKGSVYLKSRGEFFSGPTKLKGEHQKRNFKTVLTVIKVLRDKGFLIKKSDVIFALSNISIPGRFEVIKTKPLIVFDGAHNNESAKCLCQTLKKEYPKKKYVFILGILNNKDIKGICMELSKVSNDFVLIKPENPRAAEPEELAKHLKGKKIYIEQSPKKAYNKAKGLAGKNGVVVVTGSFYVIGKLRK